MTKKHKKCTFSCNYLLEMQGARLGVLYAPLAPSGNLTMWSSLAILLLLIRVTFQVLITRFFMLWSVLVPNMHGRTFFSHRNLERGLNFYTWAGAGASGTALAWHQMYAKFQETRNSSNMPNYWKICDGALVHYQRRRPPYPFSKISASLERSSSKLFLAFFGSLGGHFWPPNDQKA